MPLVSLVSPKSWVISSSKGKRGVAADNPTLCVHWSRSTKAALWSVTDVPEREARLRLSDREVYRVFGSGVGGLGGVAPSPGVCA